MYYLRISLVLALSALVVSFSLAQEKSSIEARAVANYASLVEATYKESLASVKLLEKAVVNLAADPSGPRLDAARTAWIEARKPYLLTEVFRFYNGPIDDADGPEGLLNAWPIDEAFIEKVPGAAGLGIVENREVYPDLDAKLLRSLNEKGGEANVSTGWHAIEFLLWGQDTSVKGPGARPLTDFTESEFSDRRVAYLNAAVAELSVNIGSLVAEWKPGVADNYRAAFEKAPAAESLKKILTGMSMLTGFEMASERLMVAYDTQEQEDEHSCFSDTTHNDILFNLMGIQNVYLGAFGKVKGAGIHEMAKAKDEALAENLKQTMERSLVLAKAIPVPFDQAILGKDDAPGRVAILKLVEHLEDQASLLGKLGKTMGFDLPVSEEE